MKSKRTILMTALAAFVIGCLPFVSCKEEEEDVFEDTFDVPYEITDSILVKFGDERWSTLDYSASVVHDSISEFDWIYVDAKAPGANLPYVRMKFFRGAGTHSAHMTINNPGLGYTVPGSLYGDIQCGHVFYFDRGVVHSPDGTNTSDWWPMDITMEILRYIDSTDQATAYIHGTMFDYKSWIDREVTNVEDCETREFTITFGDLPVGGR